MNVLNRLVAIIVFLLLLVLAIGTIGIVTTLLTPGTVGQISSYSPLHQSLTDLSRLPRNIRIIIVVVSVVVGLVMALLIRTELTIPARERTLVLSEGPGGEATIGLATLGKVAEQASKDIPGVDDAKCHVTAPRGSLHVQCQATAEPNANATSIGTQIEALVRERLQETLGKPVEHVHVTVGLKKSASEVRLR